MNYPDNLNTSVMWTKRRRRWAGSSGLAILVTVGTVTGVWLLSGPTPNHSNAPGTATTLAGGSLTELNPSVPLPGISLPIGVPAASAPAFIKSELTQIPTVQKETQALSGLQVEAVVGGTTLPIVTIAGLTDGLAQNAVETSSSTAPASASLESPTNVILRQGIALAVLQQLLWLRAQTNGQAVFMSTTQQYAQANSVEFSPGRIHHGRSCDTFPRRFG